jgi:hypothetical protein
VTSVVPIKLYLSEDEVDGFGESEDACDEKEPIGTIILRGNRNQETVIDNWFLSTDFVADIADICLDTEMKCVFLKF